jgi:hypothetical protein
MKKTETIKKTCFPNQTISDELLQNMTYDDMMLTIYHCQRGCYHIDNDETEKQRRNVCYQLLRILLRLSSRFEINLPELFNEVMEEEKRDHGY